MKKFVKRFLLFAFPLILILFAFELFLRKMDTSYKVKREQIGASGREAEVLIVGNSHAARLDPREFTLDAFNLAQVNQSLYFDRRITTKYIDQFKKLKYVLISVDFHSLYFSDEGERNVWSYYGYGIDYKNSLPFTEKVSYLAGYKTKFLMEFVRRYMTGRYKVIRGLEVEEAADLSQPIVKGFVPYRDTSITSMMSDAYMNERAGYFNKMVHTSGERKEILTDLEGFIADLKARNINPVLITMPCYAPYRGLLDKNVLRQNKTDILTLSEKYKIPYWDYFTMPLSRDCYLNCDHLNGKGSLIVSDSLSRDLERLKNGQPVLAARQG
ncbi:MAG TPA: hypothetical protein VHC48_05360 [Puia sp.]|nr:hypothetical protein [Puia sp.]